MNHSFNIKIAEKYGVNEAILLENIVFWIEKNKANDKHFYDGEYWTYNSANAFTKLFPYWTKRQIEHILKKLFDNGLIKKGSYNKHKYDRTLWYSLTKLSKSLYEICDMVITEKEHLNTKNVEPIPDINTDINTDINSSILTVNIDKIYECQYFNVYTDKHKEYKEIYNFDLIKEYKKMKIWLDDNPTKHKKNYNRFISNWLARVKEQNPKESDSVLINKLYPNTERNYD